MSTRWSCTSTVVAFILKLFLNIKTLHCYTGQPYLKLKPNETGPWPFCMNIFQMRSRSKLTFHITDMLITYCTSTHYEAFFLRSNTIKVASWHYGCKVTNIIYGLSPYIKDQFHLQITLLYGEPPVTLNNWKNLTCLQNGNSEPQSV